MKIISIGKPVSQGYSCESFRLVLLAFPQLRSVMKTNLEKVSQLERKLNVQIPAPAVGAAFDKVFKQVQKQAHIKGFRPGKAPLATIKMMYNDRVKQDVVQELVQKHYLEALKEHAVDPVSYPEFEFEVPLEGQDFSFTAHFEVKPEIQLKNYEGLEVEKEKLEVDEKKIEQVLENIRSSRAEMVPVLEDRAAQLGDVAVIDFEGFVDNQPLAGGQGTDHELELGSKSFIEGFEDGIVGMRVGGHTTIRLKFPDPYHSADLSGKEVEFKVTLKQLKKKSLPELTDDYLKSIGAGETVESLKKNIHDDLEKSEQKRIDQDLKNRVLKQLVLANPVDVPPSMLKEQKQVLVDDMKKKMQEQGMAENDFNDYTQKWDKDFENTANEMIQAGFLVDAIAKKHSLTCQKEDVEKKVEEYAKQTGLEIEKIRDFYSRPEQAQRITYMITEEKVLGFLLSSAKVKEVEKSKLKESAN
jgi:trigger factor